MCCTPHVQKILCLSFVNKHTSNQKATAFQVPPVVTGTCISVSHSHCSAGLAGWCLAAAPAAASTRCCKFRCKTWNGEDSRLYGSLHSGQIWFQARMGPRGGGLAGEGACRQGCGEGGRESAAGAGGVQHEEQECMMKRADAIQHWMRLVTHEPIDCLNQEKQNTKCTLQHNKCTVTRTGSTKPSPKSSAK